MSASQPAAPSPLEELLAALDVNLTLGSLVIGAVVIGMLYGITTVQTYVYYHYNRNQSDGPILRAMVLILWILDTIESSFAAHLAYHYTVTWITNPALLTSIVWSGAAHIMIGSFGDALITGLFAYRIWKLGGQKWPLLLIVPPAIIAFVSFEVIGVLAFIITDIIESQKKETWLWEMAYGLKTFSDITIMVALCSVLLRHRSQAIRRTNSIINALIFYSINTCILTSSVALASLLTYVLLPHSFFWMTLTAISPKLMLNSLLALLNSRDAMRSKMSSDTPVSIHLSRLTPAIAPSSSPSTHVFTDTEDAGKELIVHVESETQKDYSSV